MGLAAAYLRQHLVEAAHLPLTLMALSQRKQGGRSQVAKCGLSLVNQALGLGQPSVLQSVQLAALAGLAVAWRPEVGADHESPQE